MSWVPIIVIRMTIFLHLNKMCEVQFEQWHFNLSLVIYITWISFKFTKSIVKEFLNAVFPGHSYQVREYPLTFENNLKHYYILKSAMLFCRRISRKL